MRTTNLIVEILVVGLMSFCWVALAIILGAGQEVVDTFSQMFRWKPSVVVAIPVLLSFAYTLGVIINRLSDFILRSKDSRLRRSFFGGTDSESLSRWRWAQVAVLAGSESVKSRLDFGRSLLRVARSAFTNFLLLAVLFPLTLLRLGSLYSHWDMALTACLLFILLSVCSYYSWRRLAIVDYDIVHAAARILRGSMSVGQDQQQFAGYRSIEFDLSVQVIVFRILSGKVQFLVMKRTAQRGGFWQSVTGGVLDDEEAIETAVREVIEETGCRPVSIWPLQYKHEFPKLKVLPTGAEVQVWNVERSVGVQLGTSASIKLDPEEHDDYRWVSASEAMDLIEFDTNASAIQELYFTLRSVGLAQCPLPDINSSTEK
jgi:dATP pyrophosphohydrolase